MRIWLVETTRNGMIVSLFYLLGAWNQQMGLSKNGQILKFDMITREKSTKFMNIFRLREIHFWHKLLEEKELIIICQNSGVITMWPNLWVNGFQMILVLFIATHEARWNHTRFEGLSHLLQHDCDTMISWRNIPPNIFPMTKNSMI
jgi:hypothetical protein